MIPIDFSYYRPDTLQEAYGLFDELTKQGKSVVYYSGGSEIITIARKGSIKPDAVIDLKAIGECGNMQFLGEQLYIGSCVTLTRIAESQCFPFLGTTAGRVADHTNQCRITIGGNICGTIIYKETLLPMLLSDSKVVVYGAGGQREVGIGEVFKEKLLLGHGEFIVGFLVYKQNLALPYVHIKKTKNEKIDYPLISFGANVKEGRLRIAFSGLCAFPFRSVEIENTLNNTNTSLEDRVDKITTHLPAPVLDNLSGSAEYRLFVLKNTVVNIMNRLGVL